MLHSRGLATGEARRRPITEAVTEYTRGTASDRDGAGQSWRRRPGRSPATRSAAERTEQEVPHHAVRFDAAAARGRSPLRPPDAPLESQDAPVHLRRAQRDPHHRPRPDRQAARVGARVRARDRRPRRVRSCSSAPRSRPRSRSPQEATRAGPAVRQQALARRHAHELRHDPEAHRAPRAARGAPAGRRLRADDEEGSREAPGGARQAPADARRHPQDEAPPGRRLHHRPPSRADRGHRGEQARAPGRRRPATRTSTRTSSTHIIPANDDAIRAIRLLCTLVADAAIEGQQERAARAAARAGAGDRRRD